MAEHMEYHQIGRKEFERKYGIDCQAVVRRLHALWFRGAGEVK
jgi:hypothetical protein